MSYEGYYQYLCANGHLRICDCNMDDDSPCEHCGAEMVWVNCVDVTNGSHDEAGTRIDGYVELEIAVERLCVCPTCGVLHHAKAREYVIPADAGNWVGPTEDG